MWSNFQLQCVAQFSYTLVCNCYIFSSVRRKFLKFLLKIPHYLTFNIWNDWPLDRLMFKIMPFFPKLLSCPVFVHLAQFSYIDKTTFLNENARRKLMCQPPCWVLIVFSLRFVNKYRLSVQCLVYKANGYSGGGCLIDPALLIFLSLTFVRLILRSIHCLVRHLLPW